MKKDLEDNTITYQYSEFTAYYNLNNGKYCFVPNDYYEYINYIFQVNNFYIIPDNVQDSLSKKIVLSINISNSCNLKCKYCFSDKKNVKTISYSDAIKFIEKGIMSFPNAEKIFIDISGSGEPLLFLKTIIQISDRCRELSDIYNKEIITMFVSNGTLITKEISKLLCKHKILFGVSFDGYKELHDLNRIDNQNNPTYDLVINNINNLYDKTYVGGAMTITGVGAVVSTKTPIVSTSINFDLTISNSTVESISKWSSYEISSDPNSKNYKPSGTYYVYRDIYQCDKLVVKYSKSNPSSTLQYEVQKNKETGTLTLAFLTKVPYPKTVARPIC